MKIINKDCIIPYNKLVEDNGVFYLYNRKTWSCPWAKIAKFTDEIQANRIFQRWIDEYDEDSCEYNWDILDKWT